MPRKEPPAPLRRGSVLDAIDALESRRRRAAKPAPKGKPARRADLDLDSIP